MRLLSRAHVMLEIGHHLIEREGVQTKILASCIIFYGTLQKCLGDTLAQDVMRGVDLLQDRLRRFSSNDLLAEFLISVGH